LLFLCKKNHKNPNQRLWQIFDKFTTLRSFAEYANVLNKIKAEWPVMKDHPLFLELISHESIQNDWHKWEWAMLCPSQDVCYLSFVSYCSIFILFDMTLFNSIFFIFPFLILYYRGTTGAFILYDSWGIICSCNRCTLLLKSSVLLQPVARCTRYNFIWYICVQWCATGFLGPYIWQYFSHILTWDLN
jgi:hypothetical protein